MAVSDTTIQKWMEQGSTALNSGNTLEALKWFLQAQEDANIGSPLVAEVEQSLGICYRMIGSYEEAVEAFKVAYKLARTDTHKGRIERDRGMVSLKYGPSGYDEAMSYFQASLHLLGQNGQAPTDPAHRLEYYCTMGFIGRAYSVQKGKKNRQTAQQYLRTADEELRGHAPYELNNLIWRLKAEPFSRRIGLARRAWKLACEARNRLRKIQIALLLFCRPLGVRLNH